VTPLSQRLERLFRDGHAGPRDDLLVDERATELEGFKAAAVLIAVTEREDRPGFLLLHRPSNMRAHPGQVAFPGGRIDPGESAVDAALREAWEELGVPPEAVRVIGQTDSYRTGTGYDIAPVLGVIPPDLEIRPNPAEVAQWFEAPVDFVLDPANHVRKQIEFGNAVREYIEIMWGEHRIWGVTAAILANLTRRLGWHG
jgi:8-oxo-dGTP pyrophosphatase MutT (NUDIX family)